MEDNKDIGLPSFPLLDKELTEQANRKRTYFVRVVFILLLGTIAVTFLRELFSQSSQQGNALGGLMIFNAVMICQFFAVIIFLPGVMSGVITIEKERNSLELLFLTRMKAWEIIVQKYLSHVIPVMMFFFLGLPLLAVAYSFGGLDSREVYQIPILIILFIFQVGAFSLMFSAYCSTTMAAAVCSYIVTITEVILSYLYILYIPRVVLLGPKSPTDLIFTRTILFLVISTVVFLLLGVLFLKTRALTKRKSMFMLVLGSLDRFWQWTNKFFGGIELLKDNVSPTVGDNPFEWYERAKSPVGRLSYRIRLMLILYLPVLACLGKYISDGGSYYGGSYLELFRAIFLLYVIGVMITVAVCGASAISSERSNQTLDILLTTLISPREIVRQKMKRCRAYIMIFIIPVTIQAITISAADSGFAQYMVFLGIFFCVYLPLISWFSCWVGLFVKSQSRAILVSLISVASWLLLPVVLMFCFKLLSEPVPEGLLFFSPTLPFIGTFIDGEDILYHIGFVIWAHLLLGIYILLRYHCLESSWKYLRQR